MAGPADREGSASSAPMAASLPILSRVAEVSMTGGRVVASELEATPAQVALAWLLAKGDDIAPIPGTRRVARLEENVAADDVVLTADQMKRLDELTPASGGHHNEAQMQMIER